MKIDDTFVSIGSIAAKIVGDLRPSVAPAPFDQDRWALRGAGVRPRFDAKFIPEPNSGCWLWTGGVDRRGYGHFKLASYTSPQKAHRVSWALYRGEIPDGLRVCHRCDTPACVNPDHLFLGTDADNIADRDAKGRQAHPIGTEHPMAKLTDEDVRRIRNDDRAQNAIAASYGVSQPHISAIQLGKRWRHVR